MSDTTTTELERLRADLEVLERLWESVHFSECAIDFDKIKSRVRDKISSLEAEQADPWREAKEMLADKALFRSGRSRLKPVAELYDHLAAENARLEKRVKELEAENAPIDPDGYQLGDFRVMKTAQEIARYAMDRNMDHHVTVKTARRAIWAIKEFVEQARHWHGLSKLQPYRWTSLGRDDKNFIDQDFDTTESPCDYDPDACKPLADMQPPFEGPIVGFDRGKPGGDKTAIVIERISHPHDRIAMQRRIKMQRRELRRLNKKMGEYKYERYSLKNLKRFAMPLKPRDVSAEFAVVDDDPVLDPSRVLATAAEVVDLLNMDGIGYLIRHQMRHLNPKAYPVRKNPDGSPQFQRKGAENGG